MAATRDADAKVLGLTDNSRTLVNHAIQLFEYSQVGLGLYPAFEKKLPNGVRGVVDLLWKYDKQGRIKVGPPRRRRQRNLHGEFDPDDETIFINSQKLSLLPTHAQQLAGMSLVLVHEAVHAVVFYEYGNLRGGERFLGEQAARVLAIAYYRELSGLGVNNEAAEPEGKEWVKVPDDFEDNRYKDMDEAFRRNQLMDYLIGIQSYRKLLESDPRWLVDNLRTIWGGLKNRLPETKGECIRILKAAGDDDEVAGLILDILESIDRREDWEEMADHAGRLETAIAPTNTVLRAMGNRIRALETKWRVRLIE